MYKNVPLMTLTHLQAVVPKGTMFEHFLLRVQMEHDGMEQTTVVSRRMKSWKPSG